MLPWKKQKRFKCESTIDGFTSFEPLPLSLAKTSSSGNRAVWLSQKGKIEARVAHLRYTLSTEEDVNVKMMTQFFTHLHFRDASVCGEGDLIFLGEARAALPFVS